MKENWSAKCCTD